MESKLKALKVVDLKDILTKAEVAIGKANKPDLIAKILASPEALKVYEQQFGLPTTTNASESGTTLIAKPASTVQSSIAQSSAQTRATETTKPVSPAQPTASTSAPILSSPSKALSDATTATVVTTTPPTAEDLELEKRKARAARFGIPLVEPLKPRVVKSLHQTNGTKRVAPSEDSEKLEARAKRFGIQSGSVASAAALSRPGKGGKGNKRLASAMETVDAEELERRKKRAERFGTGNQASIVKV